MRMTQCMQQAGRCFLQGKLNECKTLLDNLPVIEIKRSVVLQMVQENNLLVCKDDAGTLSLDKGCLPSLAAVKQILQKLQGLPASSKRLPLELALAYNEAVLLHWQSDAGQLLDVKGMIVELEKKLMTSIKRCRVALKLTKRSRNGGVGEQLKEMTQVELDTDTTTCLSLLCCIISTYYIMNSETERALTMLDIVKDLVTCLSGLEQQNSSKISLLMKLPSENVLVRLCKDDKYKCYITSSIVEFLRACCYFRHKNFSSCLKVLQSVEKSNLSSHMLPIWEYMKGFCLYQEDSHLEAAQCLHELLKSSKTSCDSLMKARCHNLIGCCLAKQNHPNTAIQSFRDALQEDFTYLEPLYNLSLIYRQQNLWDAELESLNLLATAVENQDQEEPLSDRGLILSLSQKDEQGIFRRKHQESISLTSALYRLAKRCLELQRYSIAAEKFLDLLAVIEESDVLLNASPRQSPNGMPSIPSAETIYLEAALALYKSQQPEEAILLCDQIISKVTKPKITMATGGDDDDDDARSSCIKLSPNDISGPLTHTASTSNDMRRTDSSTIPSATARKRPRDEDDTISQSSEVTDDTVMPISKENQPKLKHLHLYCSTLLLKSQCCRTMKQFSEVTPMLDDILDLLKGVTALNSMELGLTTYGFDDSTCLGPQTKKRKLDKGDKHSTQPAHPQDPIVRILMELKSQACNDKALILIGQGKLQEAMKILLNSLNYQPDNQEALYNYILLLLKMARKQEAQDAFKKYTHVIRNVPNNRLNELQKALT